MLKIRGSGWASPNTSPTSRFGDYIAASELKPQSLRYSYASDTIGIGFNLTPQSMAAVSLQLKRAQALFASATA